MNDNNKTEIELRGKVIAMSLAVEDSLTRLIFNFFYPKHSDKETMDIYLNEFVFPKTFNQKKELLKSIYKTERYKNTLNKYLTEKRIIGADKELKSYEDYTKYVLNLLTEIISERNIMAHGYNMTGGFSALEENEMILANKAKFYKFSFDDYSQKFSDKTLKASLMLTMVDIER
jgi:hypothetical protein